MRVTESLYCRLGRAKRNPIGVNLRIYPLVGVNQEINGMNACRRSPGMNAI